MRDALSALARLPAEIAALAGQIVAAWGGLLDEDWMARIPRRAEIEAVAAQLDLLAPRRR